MRIIGLTVMVVLLLAVAGCGGDGNVVLRPDDSGTSVELGRGDTLRLELESNATTGFSWRLLDASSTPLELVASRYQAPDTDGVGAGGTEIWEFRGNQPGTARLVLVYVRPFDPDVIEGRFEVDVTVD